MRFINSTWMCVVVGAVAVLSTASDAAAVYQPHLGRFIARDPLGYIDGMGLYERTRGRPGWALDPWGKQAIQYDKNYKDNIQAGFRDPKVAEAMAHASRVLNADADDFAGRAPGAIADVIQVLADLAAANPNKPADCGDRKKNVAALNQALRDLVDRLPDDRRGAYADALERFDKLDRELNPRLSPEAQQAVQGVQEAVRRDYGGVAPDKLRSNLDWAGSVPGLGVIGGIVQLGVGALLGDKQIMADGGFNIATGGAGKLLQGAGKLIARAGSKVDDVADAAKIGRRADTAADAARMTYSEAQRLKDLLRAKYGIPVDSYDNLRNALRGQGTGFQAHHLNQNAAFETFANGKPCIPKGAAVTVPLEGNIFKHPDKAHAAFHKKLDEFWAAARRSAKQPTNADYDKALRGALTDAFEAGGLKGANDAVDAIAKLARDQRIEHGLLDHLGVPNIPGTRR